MTPDERERIAKLEQQMSDTRDDISEMKGDIKSLLAAANMGKGAWWAILKIGGFIVLVLSALAWVADHVSTWLKAH